MNSQLALQDASRELEALRKERDEAVLQLSETSLKLGRTEGERDHLRKEKDVLEGTYGHALTEHHKLKAEVERLREELAQAEESNEAFQALNEQLKRHPQELRNENDALRLRCDRLKVDCDQWHKNWFAACGDRDALRAQLESVTKDRAGSERIAMDAIHGVEAERDWAEKMLSEAAKARDALRARAAKLEGALRRVKVAWDLGQDYPLEAVRAALSETVGESKVRFCGCGHEEDQHIWIPTSCGIGGCPCDEFMEEQRTSPETVGESTPILHVCAECGGPHDVASGERCPPIPLTAAELADFEKRIRAPAKEPRRFTEGSGFEFDDVRTVEEIEGALVDALRGCEAESNELAAVISAFRHCLGLTPSKNGSGE